MIVTDKYFDWPAGDNFDFSAYGESISFPCKADQDGKMTISSISAGKASILKDDLGVYKMVIKYSNRLSLAYYPVNSRIETSLQDGDEIEKGQEIGKIQCNDNAPPAQPGLKFAFEKTDTALGLNPEAFGISCFFSPDDAKKINDKLGNIAPSETMCENVRYDAGLVVSSLEVPVEISTDYKGFTFADLIREKNPGAQQRLQKEITKICDELNTKSNNRVYSCYVEVHYDNAIEECRKNSIGTAETFCFFIPGEDIISIKVTTVWVRVL